VPTDPDQNNRLSVVAADAEYTTEDLLTEEAATIKESLGNQQTRFTIQTFAPVTEDDLQRHLSSNSPDIVHFTGHGSPTGDLVLRRGMGLQQRKTGTRLAKVLKNAGAVPQCIVFNNCSVFRDEAQLFTFPRT